jgi:hypothetical protein
VRGRDAEPREQSHTEEQLEPRRQPVALREHHARGSDGDEAGRRGEQLALAPALGPIRGRVDDEPEQRRPEGERDARIGERACGDLERCRRRGSVGHVG